MERTQLKPTMTKAMVHHGRETLEVTKTKEVLPTEEISGEDLAEVIEVTTREEETMDIAVDSMEDMAKDGMISVVKAMEVETISEVGVIGMETEIKMIREIIMTIMTIKIIEKTEDNVKTNNQIDKFCLDVQSFWTNLSWKTCRWGGYPCNQPPPQWSIAGKCIEKN